MKTVEVLVYEFEVGQKIMMGNPSYGKRELWHIRGIVDEDQIIIRYWSKRKQRWIYKVEDSYYLTLCIDDGNAEVI